MIVLRVVAVLMLLLVAAPAHAAYWEAFVLSEWVVSPFAAGGYVPKLSTEIGALGNITRITDVTLQPNVEIPPQYNIHVAYIKCDGPTLTNINNDPDYLVIAARRRLDDGTIDQNNNPMDDYPTSQWKQDAKSFLMNAGVPEARILQWWNSQDNLTHGQIFVKVRDLARTFLKVEP